MQTSMLIVDEKFFGSVKKPKYRYRSLKEHEDRDNALFKINYDLKSPSAKSIVSLTVSLCNKTDLHPPEATQFKPTSDIPFPASNKIGYKQEQLL